MSVLAGKSLAFLLPIFHMLKQDEEEGRLFHAQQVEVPPEDSDKLGDEFMKKETGKTWRPKHLRSSEDTGELLFRPRAVIIAPSRELVEQLGRLYLCKRALRGLGCVAIIDVEIRVLCESPALPHALCCSQRLFVTS